MAATDLGKVGIVMKGTWSSSATYEILDAVSYNGGTYIAKQAVPANTLPTNTTYWQAGLTSNIEQTLYDMNYLSTNGIISTSLNIIDASMRIFKISPSSGLFELNLRVNNGDTGIAKARTTLLTINPQKIKVRIVPGSSGSLMINAVGNSNVSGSGYVAAAVIPGFYTYNTGNLVADLDNGLYPSITLISGGNIKALSLNITGIYDYLNL